MGRTVPQSRTWNSEAHWRLCTAPYFRQPTSKALTYGSALSRDLTVLPAHPRVYLRTEWTIPAFAFPAEAGTHLPTRKGWKAELAWATRTVSEQSAKAAKQCLSRLLTGQSITPHWARRCTSWNKVMWDQNALQNGDDFSRRMKTLVCISQQGMQVLPHAGTCTPAHTLLSK